MTTNKRTTIQSIEEIEAEFDKIYNDESQNIVRDLRLKDFIRTKIEEILDEAIGEERKVLKDKETGRIRSDAIMSNQNFGYNQKRSELLSLKQKINNLIQ